MEMGINTEFVTILADVIIALLSLRILLKLIGFGGGVGKSLSMVGYGIVVIGFSQLVETVGLIILPNDGSSIHIVHRTLLATGFVLVFWGFGILMNKKD